MTRYSEHDLRVMKNKVRGGVKGKSSCQQAPALASISHLGTTKVQYARSAPLSLTLDGQCPSGKNAVHVRRDGHHYADKRFTNWRAEAYLQILQQHPIRPLLTTPVSLSCHYWPGDDKTRDVSGQLDALFHLLVYAKVLKDDGLIWSVWWRRHAVNGKFPRVMLSIEGWTP